MTPKDPAQGAPEHVTPEPTAQEKDGQAGAERGTRPGGADGPVVPTRSSDDTDVGWGDSPGGRGTEDDERLLREVPPHW